MSIRSTNVTRNINARKSSVPTIGKGNPLNAQGSEGDLAFRRTSSGLKLYIKANHKWHGVKIGESFDTLEKTINDIESKVNLIKQFKLPSTYSVTGDFTLDASGDVALSADGGNVTMDDGTITIFDFDVDNTAMTIHDDEDTGDKFSITVAQHGATTLATVDDDATQGVLTLDADGIINIDANANSGIAFKKNGAEFARLNGASSTSRFTMFENIGASEDDYFRIGVEAAGVTTISTVDAAGSAATLNLDIDGDITLDSGSASGRIFIKKAGADYALLSGKNSVSTFALYEAAGASTSDWFKIITDTSGETKITTNDNAGADAHLTIEPDGHVEFDGCGVGFDLVTPTYNGADTDVDFRTGNKQFVTFGGSIHDLNLYFPATSGNFTLLLKQDGTGSRTVDADGYLVFASDGSAASGSSTVKFAGGSNPTLTTDANHVDILSFFWVADNEICCGVATLDFQF